MPSLNPEPDIPPTVPKANQPGHRPDTDQDKPTGPPPRPAASIPRTTRFEFEFEASMRLPALAVGVVPSRAEVEVGEHDLTVRFGTWSLSTPLTNVAGATVTGPYAWFKVAGPPHLSFADRGITFATSTRGGVCISFHEPVRAALPVDLIRHPSATVTVADPESLVDELHAAVRRASRAAA